jgi:arginine decarboxylase
LQARTDLLEKESWTINDATALYLIDRWGSGYFRADEDGDMRVAPLQESGAAIKIMDVVREALGQGLRAPMLIRFQDLLRHRVLILNEAFNRAIAEHNFTGTYRGVFPIKVNQLREVVEEILDAGAPFSYGLECGSKPEMFAGLAVHSSPDTLIICNGYKDEQFIRMAMLGRKLDKKVIVVVEKLSEIRLIMKIAREMNVTPLIGMRVRLMAEGAGKWATSGGEHAKFGLSTSEILDALDILRKAGMESSFKLLHFHIGSQIPDILTIKRAVREAARYYAKLHKMGQQLEYLDVGGGLAIDYDGSRSTFHSSMNYTLQEYANDVVWNIMDICDEEGVSHPNIVSESGRAIVAHHSVLVVEAFGAIEKTPMEVKGIVPGRHHKLVKDLIDIENHLDERNLNESWHDLIQIKEQAQNMFELGILDLDVRAGVELLFWRIAEQIQTVGAGMDEQDRPEDLTALSIELADQHICNFSVFQSLLDHWALGQLFPIVPLHRLNEAPQFESTVVDITCDSDGKVSKFIDTNDVRETLPLHELRGDPYYLGVFLTGAYQDIMGDMHNLFGRVNEVHVFLDPDEESGYYIEETIPGNTIGEVLALTQYDRNELAKRMKQQFDAAIKQDRLRPNEAMRLLADYEKGLNDQTYLTL